MKKLVAGLCFAASFIASAHAGLIHQYDLNGTLADALGGPSLVANGGSLGPSGYTFGFGQGLSLSNPGITTVYRIELVLSLDPECDIKFCKLIDFKNLGDDGGLYTAPSNQLALFPIALAGTPVGNGSVSLVLSRDAAGIVSALKDDVLQFTVNDPLDVAAVSNNILWFFQDDGQQGNPGEHPKGFVDSIRIFDDPQGAAAPVPGTLLLLASAGLAWSVSRRKHRR